MKSVALIIVLIAAHFTGGHAQVLTFGTAGLSSPTTNAATTAANGILLNLKVDSGGATFSWMVSSALPTNAITDFYVTLVCAKGLVDIGPILGSTVGTVALLAGGNTATWRSDFMSVSTVGAIGTTTTADAYIIAPGQTVRYTFDPTGAGNYWGVNIRDVTANSIQGTPCNSNAGAQSGTSTKCPLFLKTAGLQMGFEVLNKGNAYLCIQTPAQWATGNSCDSEATLATTCTATLSNTYSATAKCTNKIYHNACTDTCPSGTYAYTTDATAGCVECSAALDANNFCVKTIVANSPPSTASSSLLRVGQIAAMFVGSIYFVLFA